MNYRFRVLVCTTSSLCVVSISHADPPLIINAQGLVKTNGGNNHVDMLMNDNRVSTGGRVDWDYNGNNALRINLENTQLTAVCWKHFIRTSPPHRYTVVTNLGGSYPNNALACTTSTVEANTSSTGYIAATGHELYIGDVKHWAASDYMQGTIRHSFKHQIIQLCLNVDNVL